MRDLGANIAGTFELSPLSLFEAFWAARIRCTISLTIAPVGSLHQSILSGHDNNAAYPIVIFLRENDILANGSSPGEYVEELQRSLLGTETRVIIFADGGRGGLVEHLHRAFDSERYINVELLSDVFDLYRVDDIYNRVTEASAFMPYTMEAYGAISAALIRRLHAYQRQPMKLIGVDCDQTLWKGVVAEDGVDGIHIDAAHQEFHRMLAQQASAGRIVTLLSKNDEADIDRVFKTRDDFLLSRDAVLDMGLGWEPKSKYLQRMMERFHVAENATLFLDDSPIEVAEMQSALAAVPSVIVPVLPDELSKFVNHYWPFDVAALTDEDRQRARRYRDEAARADTRKQTTGLRQFIEGLELQVSFHNAGAEAIDRLSQLTQRTNQFNMNLARYDRDQLRAYAADKDNTLIGISVCDRFGDYGTVGLLGVSIRGEDAQVNLFMLSCRALNRGVEHQMLAHAANLARTSGATALQLDFERGLRNRPAEIFLEALTGQTPQQGMNPVAIAQALDARLDPERCAGTTPAPLGRPTPNHQSDQPDWREIAMTLNSGSAIVNAMRGARQPRPDVSTSFVAPAPGLQRDIADIWCDCLRLSSVGVNDNFTDLGGSSLHLVQIHARLVGKLNREIPLTLLFEHGTISALADRLSGQDRGDRTAMRAAAMKAARGAQRARSQHTRGDH